MERFKVVIAILAKNEEKQIPRLVNMLRYADANRILFFDDNSNDFSATVFANLLLADKKWQWHPLTEYERFDSKKNEIQKILSGSEYKWILHIDADEIFDPFFLRNIKLIIRKAPNSLSFAFKRINMPNGRDFPDYQVRLLKNDPDIEWKGRIHEKVFSKSMNKSLIDLSLRHKDNINTEGILFCSILEEFPIIHLPRRTDIKRPWW